LKIVLMSPINRRNRREEDAARRERRAKKEEKREAAIVRDRAIHLGGQACCRRSKYRVQLPAFLSPDSAALLTEVYDLTVSHILTIVPSADDLLFILRANKIFNKQYKSRKAN
jgi:hypothetical protein